MISRGTFQTTVKLDPPYDDADGVSLGHATVDKQFEGGIVATSVVHMIGARTAVPTSAGYVAIERVVGTVDGKRGAFVLQHTGTMKGGSLTLVVTVVPDSGTGELKGISGSMTIEVVEKKHHYTFDYAM